MGRSVTGPSYRSGAVKLGFVTAILPELSLEQLVEFAAAEGFQCIEVMCEMPQSDRRYGGVAHINVVGLDRAAAERVRELLAESGVEISGLAYYSNPLAPEGAKAIQEHVRKVIQAAEMLGVNQMNSFVGRDCRKSVDENWPQFQAVWKPLVGFAEDCGVRIGIENCPMYFTPDEWPGGTNLAYCPAIWRRMFEEIPSRNFGLNYDPSHLVWQRIDYIKPLREFADRIFHIHAKDARIDCHRLDDVGIMATPLEFHCPKLPGLGEVDWRRYLSVLGDVGYRGPVCIEVEDRAYEGSLESRKTALRQSARFLRQFLPNEQGTM